MKLENYIDFNQKDQLGIGNKITTFDDINKIFNQFVGFYSKENNDRLIFRGINEASYKMYTTSQRDWIINHSNKNYSSYLEALIDTSKGWNNGILKKYLKSISSTFTENNLGYLSVMQHYGLASPLLDFTYNPFTALYFAAKDVEKCFYDDDCENIRNFFSVYFIYPEWAKYKCFTKDLIDLDLQNLKNEAYHLVDYNVVFNNLNIIAQEGSFFVNTFSKEDLITAMQITRNAKDKVRFGCYNIHKSFAKPIMERLVNKGITKTSLFPDFNMLKK